MSEEGKTFSNDHEFASEQGKVGGKTQPDEVYKPSEHDGLKKNGEPDKRMSSEHGFGGDRERASEEGKKGGRQGGKEGEEEQ
ncbi:uncharacterized protein JCM6883_003658 [Sporobolomyces salmoneus]|uniref:uncharacterized protein n=1 Tax=Sporobolomyces salmoneus TaxID=183962 RepID=UPI0031743853